jgi:DNA repair protein RecO (recombination protein O)
MQAAVELQPAYLLHAWPYRETSLLVDFLTRDHGRVRAVAKGVRSPRSKIRGILQAFVPLKISFGGRHELKTLSNLEVMTPTMPLQGQRLFSAMYLNELLVRLVHGVEAEPELFQMYEQTLTDLRQVVEIEPCLREFEIGLLDLLGYGIHFDYEALDGNPISTDQCYQFQSGLGFVAVHDAPGSREYSQVPLFMGATLLAIDARDFSHPLTRRAAKQLLRLALRPYLGDKPLKSRQLFQNKL